ncbi:hypothetical protein EK904_003475 [Melospiza melodia maxima]|nr:hypothetical protein EK904_003475 [Melospiza melodia maxima]
MAEPVKNDLSEIKSILTHDFARCGAVQYVFKSLANILSTIPSSPVLLTGTFATLKLPASSSFTIVCSAQFLISCCWLLSLSLSVFFSYFLPFHHLTAPVYPYPCCDFTSQKLEGAGAHQLRVGVHPVSVLLWGTEEHKAALHLPVFLFITGEHLSVDKTLLWDDSNHRKYSREGAKPRGSYLNDLMFRGINMQKDHVTPPPKTGYLISKLCWQQRGVQTIPRSTSGTQVCQSSRHPGLKEPKEGLTTAQDKIGRTNLPRESFLHVITFCGPFWQFVPASSSQVCCSAGRLSSLPCVSQHARQTPGRMEIFCFISAMARNSFKLNSPLSPAGLDIHFSLLDDSLQVVSSTSNCRKSGLTDTPDGWWLRLSLSVQQGTDRCPGEVPHHRSSGSDSFLGRAHSTCHSCSSHLLRTAVISEEKNGILYGVTLVPSWRRSPKAAPTPGSIRDGHYLGHRALPIPGHQTQPSHAEEEQRVPTQTHFRLLHLWTSSPHSTNLIKEFTKATSQNGDISSTWNKMSHALRRLQPDRQTGTATAPSDQAAATPCSANSSMFILGKRVKQLCQTCHSWRVEHMLRITTPHLKEGAQTGESGGECPAAAVAFFYSDLYLAYMMDRHCTGSTTIHKFKLPQQEEKNNVLSQKRLDCQLVLSVKQKRVFPAFLYFNTEWQQSLRQFKIHFWKTAKRRMST